MLGVSQNKMEESELRNPGAYEDSAEPWSVRAGVDEEAAARYKMRLFIV